MNYKWKIKYICKNIFIIKKLINKRGLITREPYEFSKLKLELGSVKHPNSSSSIITESNSNYFTSRASTNSSRTVWFIHTLLPIILAAKKDVNSERQIIWLRINLQTIQQKKKKKCTTVVLYFLKNYFHYSRNQTVLTESLPISISVLQVYIKLIYNYFNNLHLYVSLLFC